MSTQVVPRDEVTETRREMLCRLRDLLVTEGDETLRDHMKRLAKAWGLRTPTLVRAKAA